MINNKEKIILVTGATGQQGYATIRHLLAGSWSVRALTRDPNKPSAKALRNSGVEVFQGDNDNRDSLEKAMQGVHGVFSFQPTEYSADMSPDFGYDDEVRLGMNVADAAKNAGVQHFVYSSVAGVENLVGSRNYSKWEIEQYIRKIQLPVTILRPVWFMENFIDSLTGLQDFTFATAIQPSKELQLIAVDDIGAFATKAFENPDRYLGVTIEIAGDSLTPTQITTSISQATGREIFYAHIPIEMIRQKSETAAKVFNFINNKGYKADIPVLREMHLDLMNFDQWMDKVGKGKLKMLFNANHK
jgi:uncharacterized protein YbjT (DUF2867 family)